MSELLNQQLADLNEYYWNAQDEMAAIVLARTALLKLIRGQEDE